MGRPDLDVEKIARGNPQVAGALFTIRKAREGDPIAQQIIHQYQGPNNLIRTAAGLPCKALTKERPPAGEP